MKHPELAVCVDDFRLDVKSGFDRARALGFRAVDVGAVGGPISPQELSRTGQRHLLRHLSDLGLRLASLRGPTGGGGYIDAVESERRLELTRRIIDLAYQVAVPVVTTSLGAVEPASAARQEERLREALSILADQADRAGVVVAVETTGLSTGRLRELVAAVNCPKLAACCDTGALLMRGEDPHRVSETLAGRVGLVRARDAVAGTAESTGYETAPGEGQLDVAELLADLERAGFAGDIVLTRTTGQNPARDLAKAKARFEEHLARLRG